MYDPNVPPPHEASPAKADPLRPQGSPARPVCPAGTEVLTELIGAQARRTPRAVALRFAGQELTFGDVDRLSERVAAKLHARGVRRGDLVPICMERCLGLVVGLVSILRAGAAYVPLDPDFPHARISFMLDDTQAIHVLAQDRFAEQVARSEIDVIVLSENGDVVSPVDTEWLEPAIAPTDLAYVIYTSGSTGRPKGAMNEHGAVANRILWMIRALGIGPEDRILQKTPMSFDVSVWEFFVPLVSGSLLVIARPGEHLDPLALGRTMAEEGVTLAHFVPPMLAVFLDEPTLAECRSLRALVCSGEALLPLHVQLVREKLGCSLWNMYGPTEAAVDVTYHLCDVDRDRQTVPIGRPIDNAVIYVVDDAGQRCPPGVPGELWIGGLPVGRGYLRREALTKDRFLTDPFDISSSARVYRTGDRACWRPDGALEYLGRIDQQVKIHGIRIEPGEIEAALAACPGVREAAVVSHSSPVRGTELVAYVARTLHGPELEAGALRKRLSESLPAALVPWQIILLDELPRTASGKLDRRSLPAPDERDGRVPEEIDTTPGSVETCVLGVWREVLGSGRIGLDDDFLRWGGHSLLAIKIAARLESILETRLPVADVLAARTARRLAATLEHAKRGYAGAIPRLPRESRRPLSLGQLGLWLEHRLDEADPAFHVPLAFRLTGPLDRPALQQSITALSLRHAALRTRFLEDGEGPLQVTDDVPEVELAFFELPSANSAPADIERLLNAEIQRPFQLATRPPFRAAVFRVGLDENVLLLCFHHIAVDDWSVELLLRELGALYFAAHKAQEPQIGPLALQMPDVSAWLHSKEAKAAGLGADLEAADAATTLPPPFSTELPILEPSARRIDEFTPSLADLLRQYAEHAGVTVFEVALAAFGVLLFRYTGQERLVIGTPKTLRDRLELEGVVGYLLEMQAVPVAPAIAGNFRALLSSVGSQLSPTALSRHSAQVPSGGTRGNHGDRRPFPVVFTLLHEPLDRPDLSGLSVEPIPTWAGSAKYDLSLSLTLGRDRACCEIEYRRDRLSDAVASTLSQHFERLLRWLVTNPDRPLSEAQFLSHEERQRALQQWNPPLAVDLRTLAIHRVFEQRADETPDEVAVVCGEERWTYGHLDTAANQLAHQLSQRGVRPGDRVPLCMERSPLMLAAILGILKVGAAYVPVDPEEAPARLQQILDDLEARGLLVGPGTEAQAPIRGIERIVVDPAFLRTFPKVRLAHEAPPQDPACIMFTSGTSGRPKGVVVPHLAVLRLVLGQDYANMDSARTWLHFSPAWFDASTLEIWAPLLNGGRVVLLPGGLPTFDAISEAIRKHAVDSLWLSSSFFNAVVDHDPTLLSGLYQLLIGGEALSPAHVLRARQVLPQLRIVNGYGPTENTTFTACHQITDLDLRNGAAIPIGRPIAGTSVYILDVAGALAPVGIIGELCAGGCGVTLGYLGGRDETGRFGPDPFSNLQGARLYRTGDQARWRPDGVLEFMGRRDRLIKLRGFRIEPGEIETALLRHPGVASAVVDVVEAPSGARQLAAWFVAPAGGPMSSPTELARHMELHVPPYMLPAHYVALETIPLLENGKLDRARLPRPDLRPASPASEHSLVRSPTEARVERIWSEVLALDGVGARDDFFELGGTSLLAVRMLGRVEQELGVKMPGRSLFSDATLRGFARQIDNREGQTRTLGVVLLRQHASGEPLFCLPGIGGHVFSYRDLLRHLPPDRPVYGIQFEEFAQVPGTLDSVEALATALLEGIRSVRSRGPYDLLGYSFGGMVAYEMMRQLESTHEGGGLLIVVDTYPPGVLRLRRGFEKAIAHARELRRRSRRDLLRRMGERVRRWVAWLRGAVRPPAGAQGPPLERARRGIAWRCHAAFDRYMPLGIDTPLTFLRALRLSNWHIVQAGSSACGWDRYVRGGVDVQELECEHLDVFTEPHITRLGELIVAACRRRARRCDTTVVLDPRPHDLPT